jgi:hypothetical protein
LSGEEATYRVYSDIREMAVCAAAQMKPGNWESVLSLLVKSETVLRITTQTAAAFVAEAGMNKPS